MAIFHCHVSSIGKATQKRANTSSASVAYSLRMGKYEQDDLVHREIFHVDPKVKTGKDYINFVKSYEKQSRSNARILEKVEVALPKEFSREQQIDLVRQFMGKVGKGELTNYAFAIHDSGNGNPHAHISFVAIDGDGKRIIDISSGRNSCEGIRKNWAESVNEYAKHLGMNLTIDHRSYNRQGIDQFPTIHIGRFSKSNKSKERATINEMIQIENLVTINSIDGYLNDIDDKMDRIKNPSKYMLDKLDQSNDELNSKITNIFDIKTTKKDLDDVNNFLKTTEAQKFAIALRGLDAVENPFLKVLLKYVPDHLLKDVLQKSNTRKAKEL